MQITVIDVGQPNTHTAKNGRSYQSMEVTYKGENGNVASKKLMSFSNPDVFKTAQTWAKNDTVNVNTQKDDNGYWQWLSILGEGESAPVPVQGKATATPNKSATRVTGSNYETKEERASRQVMIVRQSSISSAVNALTADGKSPTANEVLDLAKTFEAYVMDSNTSSIADMKDDIPI